MVLSLEVVHNYIKGVTEQAISQRKFVFHEHLETGYWSQTLVVLTITASYFPKNVRQDFFLPEVLKTYIYISKIMFTSSMYHCV